MAFGIKHQFGREYVSQLTVEYVTSKRKVAAIRLTESYRAAVRFGTELEAKALADVVHALDGQPWVACPLAGLPSEGE